MDFLDFRGPRFSGLWRPLAAFGSLLAAFGDNQLPLKEGLWSFGGLEAWILDAWRLGGLEAWSLVALAEAGGLEARGFEAGQAF